MKPISLHFPQLTIPQKLPLHKLRAKVRQKKEALEAASQSKFYSAGVGGWVESQHSAFPFLPKFFSFHIGCLKKDLRNPQNPHINAYTFKHLDTYEYAYLEISRVGGQCVIKEVLQSKFKSAAGVLAILKQSKKFVGIKRKQKLSGKERRQDPTVE